MATKRCRRKWKHKHVMKTGEIRVFSNKDAEKLGRYVVIADDGSICDKYAQPDSNIYVPSHWFGRKA